MTSGSTEMHENTTSSADLVDGQQIPTEGTDDKSKTPRHPRWSRQETLLLIEGKKITEDAHRGRKTCSIFGSDKPEPKWNSISSYCRQYGANRGPTQCRKRWSNMISDFKKIKTWESQENGSSESYWTMRNDLRRENKLPSFFDREVYDVLDGKELTAEANQLALVTITDEKVDYGRETVEEEEEEEEEDEDEEQENREAEAISHTGRYIIEDDVLLSPMEEIGSNPLKEGVSKDKKAKFTPSPMPISGEAKADQSGSDFWRSSMFQDRVKKRRQPSDGCTDTSLEYKLLKTLEQNTNMLHKQLDAQINNRQLDSEQHKENSASLIAAIHKVADALARVADKM